MVVSPARASGGRPRPSSARPDGGHHAEEGLAGRERAPQPRRRRASPPRPRSRPSRSARPAAGGARGRPRRPARGPRTAWERLAAQERRTARHRRRVAAAAPAAGGRGSRLCREVRPQHPPGQRGRALAAPPALLDDAPRSRPSGASAGAKPMNHEWGSPVPPSCAVPDLPAVGTPGTFAPSVKSRPYSPSTARVIASTMAAFGRPSSTRPMRPRLDRRLATLSRRPATSRAAAPSARHRSPPPPRRGPSGAASTSTSPWP